MTDGNGNAGAAGGNTGGTPGAGGNSGQTWYQTAGVDAETVGHWQNKGWDVTDPTKTVLAATKAHREAERLIGMRADHDMLPIPRDLTKGDMNPV